MPLANNGSIDPLAAHLGSLYLSGNNSFDSYDVGLSIVGEKIPIITRKPSAERKQLRKQRVGELSAYVIYIVTMTSELLTNMCWRTNADLMSRLENIEEIVATNNNSIKIFLSSIKILLSNNIDQNQRDLNAALLVRRFETVNRILQGVQPYFFSLAY